MIVIKELSDIDPPVHIVSDSSSSTASDGVVRATSLTIKNVLFASKIPISLSSISQFTKNNNCSMILFPSYCVFQNLQTGIRIGTGHEKGGMCNSDEGITQIQALLLAHLIFFYSGTSILVIHPSESLSGITYYFLHFQIRA